MSIVSIKNEREMAGFATSIAKEVLGLRRVNAMVLALAGDLGAGKTTFAQGFARALGIKAKVTSPTFLILKRFKIQNSFFMNFYHIDAYRLHSSKELLDLGLADLLKDPQNIILIEWADKIKELLPKNARWLRFMHGKKEEEREVDI